MSNPYPQWFSTAELEAAHANYQQTQGDNDGSGHKPVVKLFTPDAQCSWLISEISPADNDYAFGLCDLGMGSPALGYVLLSDIASVRGNLDLPVERDLHFHAEGTVLDYATAARRQQRIVGDLS